MAENKSIIDAMKSKIERGKIKKEKIRYIIDNNNKYSNKEMQESFDLFFMGNKKPTKKELELGIVYALRTKIKLSDIDDFLKHHDLFHYLDIKRIRLLVMDYKGMVNTQNPDSSEKYYAIIEYLNSLINL